ncbi:MAG: hypothetical protein D6771_03030 [Zetaproteobacteria bacterium]|nr:MAG: hypothetical protein D6771_03030 [Zetaproteobacteria bacterium]
MSNGRSVCKLEVSFTTPAFLGGSDQSAQWRTPPFKALLRQWWRVAYAAERSFSVNIGEMRKAERELFGGAAGSSGSRSRVHLRMDWRGGSERAQAWRQKRFATQEHPETDDRNPRTDLYLFYGVVNQGRLQRKAYLQENRPCIIGLGFPGAHSRPMMRTLLLSNWFGTLGGRSRNGSGSVVFRSADDGNHPWDVDWGQALDPGNAEARAPLRALARDWREALGADWIHAVGQDERGLLIWRTQEAFDSWEKALDALAMAKIAYRTLFHFKGGGRPHQSLCDRQVIAYPITRHSLRAWGNQARLANQMIMKVHKMGGKYVGVIAHLPHGLPSVLRRRLSDGDQSRVRGMERNVWRRVHAALDGKLDDEIRNEARLSELLMRLG